MCTPENPLFWIVLPAPVLVPPTELPAALKM
jgi:hypothetical protein